MGNPSSEHDTVEEIDDASFFPKGAIAFFVLLMVLFLVLWFSMYIDMLSR